MSRQASEGPASGSAGPVTGIASLAGAASHYETLAVGCDGTPLEISKAFKRQALRTHPDKGGRAESFHAVCRAFEVLHDPLRRSVYDEALRQIAAGLLQETRARPADSETPAQQTKRPRPAPQECHEEELYHLLQRLPAVSRRCLIEKELCEQQRRSLEKWVLAYRARREESVDGAGDCVGALGDEMVDVGRVGCVSAVDDDMGEDDVQASRVASKGLVSMNCGKYKAEVHFESLSVAGRTVVDLDAALQDLVLLLSLKQGVQADCAEPLGTTLRRNVLAIVEREGKSEEQLGFSYLVRTKQTFWTGRMELRSPTLKRVDEAVRTWDRWAHHRMPRDALEQLDLEQIQGRWEAFRSVYAETWAEIGGQDQAKRDAAGQSAFARLDALVEKNEGHRERVLQLREARRKKLETDRVKREARKQQVAAIEERKTLDRARRVITKWSAQKVREEKKAAKLDSGSRPRRGKEPF